MVVVVLWWWWCSSPVAFTIFEKARGPTMLPTSNFTWSRIFPLSKSSLLAILGIMWGYRGVQLGAWGRVFKVSGFSAVWSWEFFRLPGLRFRDHGRQISSKLFHQYLHVARTPVERHLQLAKGLEATVSAGF